MTPLSVLGLTYASHSLALSLFFSFRSDCIELDFKEISYLVLNSFWHYKITSNSLESHVSSTLS